MGERLQAQSNMDISWYFATFKTFGLKKGKGAFIRAGLFNRNNTIYLVSTHTQFWKRFFVYVRIGAIKTIFKQYSITTSCD